MAMKKVVYVNIDSWNRPIFKQVDAPIYYGSTEKLFRYEERESDVLKKVIEADLTYFGSHFDCEPMGSDPCHNLEIVKRDSLA